MLFRIPVLNKVYNLGIFNCLWTLSGESSWVRLHAPVGDKTSLQRPTKLDCDPDCWLSREISISWMRANIWGPVLNRVPNQQEYSWTGYLQCNYAWEGGGRGGYSASRWIPIQWVAEYPPPPSQAYHNYSKWCILCGLRFLYQFLMYVEYYWPKLN